MDVAQEIHRCGHWLQAAIDQMPSRITLEDLPGLIESGRLALFTNDHAAVVVEPVPEGFTIIFAGGELNACFALHEDIERMARAAGARYLNVVGRPGWGKVLKSRGYGTAAVLLRKELSDERSG